MIKERGRRIAVLISCLVIACVMHGVPARAGSPEPQRLVALGGAVTQTVIALGAADRLIAVDLSSRSIGEVSNLPNVGYYRQLAAEPIMALQPTLVLASDGAGPEAVFDQLAAAGIDVVRIPDVPSIAGIADKIAVIAKAIGAQEQGRALASRIDRDFADLSSALADRSRPRAMLVLSVGRGAPMTAGQGTAGDAILQLAGAINVGGDHEGYKPMSPEAIVAAAPEWLVVPSHVAESLGGLDALRTAPGFSQTPAISGNRVLKLDSLDLLGFGPGTAAAAIQLAHALHPQLALATPSADVD